MEKSRDSFLDFLRGIAMFQVVLVHILYWSGLLQGEIVTVVKSFFLFEMPLFFFVTGAVNGIKKSYENLNVPQYFKLIKKRFLRILFPYWVYAFFCILLNVAYLGLTNETHRITDIICIGGGVFVLRWLLAFSPQSYVPFLTWALWFIPTYLTITLFIPFMIEFSKGKLKVFPLLFFIMANIVFDIYDFNFLQQVSFYCFWVYIGLFYKEIIGIISKKSFVFPLIFLVSAASLFIFHKAGFSIDMQIRKFPPDFIFGIYSIGAISLVFFIAYKLYGCFSMRTFPKIIRKFFFIYSNNSMTIFLYQTFVFCFLWIMSKILHGIVPDLLVYFFALPLCAVVGKVFSIFEQPKDLKTWIDKNILKKEL